MLVSHPVRVGAMFRDNAPTTAAQAATVILDGVRAERWRILVGDDAVGLDRLVREHPEEAYEDAHFKAREMLVPTPDDDLGSVTLAGEKILKGLGEK